MTPRRLTASLLAGLSLGLGLACGDGTGPASDTTRPPSQLRILRLAPGAALFNPVDSFYARKGQDRELRMFLQDGQGGSGEEFLRLRVDAPSLLARPDGTPFAVGDSILITVRLVDPARILVELEPSGLTFSSIKPAELKLDYGAADPDYNDDGVTDSRDSEVEQLFSIWRQASPGADFQKVGSLRIEEFKEVDATLLGFSRYAIAY